MSTAGSGGGVGAEGYVSSDYPLSQSRHASTNSIDSRVSGRIPYKSHHASAAHTTATLPSDIVVSLILIKTLLSLALLVTKHWLIDQKISIFYLNFILLSTSALSWRAWTSASTSSTSISPSSTKSAGKPIKLRQDPVYSILLTVEVLLFLLALSKLSVFKTILLTTFSSLWTGGFPFPSAGGRKTSSNNAFVITIGLVSSCFLLDRLLSASSASFLGYSYLLLHLLVSGSRLDLLEQQLGDSLSKAKSHSGGTLSAAVVSGAVALLKWLFDASSHPVVDTDTPLSLLPIPSLGLLLPFAILLGLTFLVVDPLLSRVLTDAYPRVRQFSIGWPIASLASLFVGYVGFGQRAGLSDLAVGGVSWTVINHLISSNPRSAAIATSSFTSPTPFLSRSSNFYRHLRSTIKTIMATQDSRRIYFFLCLNLAYMVVQMVYGIWTNSLGLISDSIHMFFDCLALGMGLFASVMANWERNHKFTYGYSRVETLSGFANGLFLCLISIFIIFEAIQRLIDPPEMNTSQLLVVSSVGLAVNLVGMYATGGHHHHGHSHGGHDHGPPKPKAIEHHDHSSHGNSSHDHSSHDHSSHDHSSHDHSSHDHSSHDHSSHDHFSHDHDEHDNDHGHAHAHSHNMKGVFLHVMADTLGSVGVIISTILINSFGWTGFDPLASIFIAVLIFASVVPLVVDSGMLLVLDMGEDRELEVKRALASLHAIEGLSSYSSARFWPKDPATMIGSVHIQLSLSTPSSSTRDSHSKEQHEQQDYANAEIVKSRVNKVLKNAIGGLSELCIQVEPQHGY